MHTPIGDCTSDYGLKDEVEDTLEKLGRLKLISELQRWFELRQQDSPEKFRKEFFLHLGQLARNK